MRKLFGLVLFLAVSYMAKSQCAGQYSGAVSNNTQTTVDIQEDVVTLMISDILGRVVQAGVNWINADNCEIQDLKTGIYFMELKSGADTTVVKLVKSAE